MDVTRWRPVLTAAVLAATLTACAPGALAPTTSATPNASAPTAPETTGTPPAAAPIASEDLDTGAGPDPVAEPTVVAPPIPTTCAELDAAPLAEQWRAAGFVLEDFDGIVVGGGFAPATDAGGSLTVHCILWTAQGALGPHVLVELYRGADPATVVAHPMLAGYVSAPLATASGDVTLVDSSGSGIASSQETVGGHGDAVLRTFTVGMPLSSPPGLTGPHAMVLLFESVFGTAPATP